MKHLAFHPSSKNLNDDPAHDSSDLKIWRMVAPLRQPDQVVVCSPASTPNAGALRCMLAGNRAEMHLLESGLAA